jgi:hypothetical protein
MTAQVIESAVDPARSLQGEEVVERRRIIGPEPASRDDP